jgi:transposase
VRRFEPDLDPSKAAPERIGSISLARASILVSTSVTARGQAHRRDLRAERGDSTFGRDPRARIYGSANLLVRYLNQGRADAVRKPPSPRRLVSWLMTRPASLPAHHQEHLEELLTRCAYLNVLSERVKRFADLLTGRRGEELDAWMTTVDADDLPALHGFVHGLRMDLQAVVAGLTLPYSNGPIEGANTKVEFLKRQMYVALASPSYDSESCSRSPITSTTASAPEPFV